MKSLLTHRYLILVSRYGLGIVFIIASIDKIAVPDAFAESIVAYGIVPYSLVNLIALIIPWLELVCGIFLVGGVYLKPSAALLSALLAIFILAITTALLRELKIDCGCFGKDHATPVSWMKVWEDIVLWLLGLHVYFFSSPVPIPKTSDGINQ